MKNKTTRLTLALLFILQLCNLNAQLANGSTAPDFTATDLNGTSYNLYSILNSGKTVYIDISATWCGPCWQYHETHALKDLYNQYGPPGTNEVMVFFVEGDGSTTLADLNGTGGNTQGNWVTGTPYPILDNANIANSYQIAYYPTVYMICPNKTVTEVGTQTAAQLYAQKANCPPLAATANFSASTTTPCIGSTVTFTDQSSGNPTGWSWSFSPNTVTYTGGTSSTSQNPKVQFNAAGPYTVTLNISGGLGSDSEVKTSYITPNSTVLTLPLNETFEGTTFPPTNWTVQNSDAPSVAWGSAGAHGLERRTATGNTGSASGCVGLNCFNYADTSKVDNLITGNISLSGAVAPRVTFKRAYKTYVSATNPNNYRDELKVYVSTDCGTTWGSAVYFKKGAQLATSGNLNTTFSPSAAGDWDTDTVNLTSYVGQNVMIKFEFVNRYGNNLYVDDINISNGVAPTASVSIAASTTSAICSGTSVTFTATPTNGGTPTYQWKVNGTNVGTNSATYTTSTLTNGQVVTCVMTSSISGTTQATSNSITVTVNPTPATPTVTTNSPVCAGSAVTITTPNVSSATYAWTGPNGFTSSQQNPSLSNSTTAMSGTYSCVVTANGCSSTAGTASVTVNPSVTPSGLTAITAGGNPTCVSQSVTFTATPTNGGTTPSYQWKVNGVNAGTNAATFTPATINNNDVISCVITSNALCASPATATTNSITMQITTSVTPAVSISAPSTSICSGTSVTFTPAPTNGGATPSYVWNVNGTQVSTGTTYTTSSLNNNDVVTCVMTSNSACASPTTATSNSVTVTVNPTVTPSVSITNNGSNSVCAGAQVSLTAGGTNGGTNPQYQWLVNGIASGQTGTSFQSSTLTTGSVITCSMVSNAACATTSTVTSNPITITVNPAPVFTASSNGPICAGNDLTLSTTNLPNATYAWSGPAGFSSSQQNPSIVDATTNASGTYTLTVTQNGCTATNSVSVTVNSAPAVPTISVSGMVLTSSATSGNQWFMNGVMLTGAISSTLTMNGNGNYSVVVTENGCSAESSMYSMTTWGIDEASFAVGMDVYPNPTSGVFTIDFKSTQTVTYTIEVRNVSGQLVDKLNYQANQKENKLDYDLSTKEKGVYFIRISNGLQEKVQKIVLL